MTKTNGCDYDRDRDRSKPNDDRNRFPTNKQGAWFEISGRMEEVTASSSSTMGFF